MLKYIKIIKDHISKEVRETLTKYLTVILSSNPNIPEEIKEQVENIKGEPAKLAARLDRGFNKIKKMRTKKANLKDYLKARKN